MPDDAPQDPAMSGVTLSAAEALQAAIAHHQGQRWVEAERLYRAILQAQPSHPDANYYLGILAVQLGKTEAGLPHIAAALAAKPGQSQYRLSYIEALLAAGRTEDAQANLEEGMRRGFSEIALDKLRARFGHALLAQGKPEAAIESFEQALAIRPDNAEILANLAEALAGLDRLDEAIARYERAVVLDPCFLAALSNLGNALKQQGRPEEAIARYEQALAIDPECAEVHCNLGTVLADLGKLDQAIVHYERALAIRPSLPEALLNLGKALKDQGRSDEAIARYEQALALRPNYPSALTNLGIAFRERGRLDEAVARFEQVVAIRPDDADALYNLGNALLDQRKLKEAVLRYEQVIAIKPDSPAALTNLGAAFQGLGRLEEAASLHERALAFEPNFPEVLSNLGTVLQEQGRLEEAAQRYEQALAIRPGYRSAYSNLLFVRAAQPSFEADRYLALARQWEEKCASAPIVAEQEFRRRPLAGRRLRLGYVSGDYWGHAVSYFIEQLFKHHDRDKVELFAYNTSVRHDNVTARLHGMVDHWLPLTGLSDMAARARILADEIDVLVDLSGHSAYNRLSVFALRAAPVQVHYLGFFASTGLSQMDYWIGDEILTPPDTDAQFQETVWRLPRVWVSYDATNDAPAPAWRPAMDGSLWLGSFNNLVKLTPEIIALWARVLHSLPEGRLLLKTRALTHPGVRQRILAAFAAHGIAADRIELAWATTDWRRHMAYYDRLDIALDPAGGVGGGTTTCDALWMGVPVVTLGGNRMATRMTASMLHAIGRPEWIARDEQDYIDRVVALARDVEARRAMRGTQRARMAASPLCDPTGLARALEEAFTAMFEQRS
jgi:protein O-GlcNAc transferase